MARPGSPEKAAVLAVRYETRRACWNPLDAKLDPADPAPPLIEADPEPSPDDGYPPIQ